MGLEGYLVAKKNRNEADRIISMTVEFRLYAEATLTILASIGYD